MKISSLFFIIVTVLCFAVIFSWGWDKSRKEDTKIEEIQKIAGNAVENYLENQSQRTQNGLIEKFFQKAVKSSNQCNPGLTFTSCPIFYDHDGCVVECYLDTAASLGTGHRKVFDVVLQRERRIWKATIIKVNNDQSLTSNKNI